jgi:hypothetical protein
MDFGNAYLFNKKPEDMRRIGVLGGRARARNIRLRKACLEPVAREIARPYEETAAEAIQRIDTLCPWLVGAEHREGRRWFCRRCFWHARGRIV